MTIDELVNKQHAFFFSGQTLSIDFRINALKKLKKGILKYEKELNIALKNDLGKSDTESYMCEIGLTLDELSFVTKHIKSWSKDRRVRTPLAQFHAKSFTVQEPYGLVLIMSPWNYPVTLTLEPLIGALAAGNCCIIKPSAYSPETSRTIARLIRDTFPENYVAVVEGGRQENQDLLVPKFDYIFFTGGVKVGKMVMEKAAAHLTPVTLELGGKSPCIIDHTANLKIAARRLVFGKFLNCGQTCIAPDYVLAEECIIPELTTLIKEEIVSMFGKEPLKNKDYGKIINKKHFDRILGLIDPSKVIFGGEHNAETLQISPTILTNITVNDAIMQEEIFGPLLPIISIPTIDTAYHFVRDRPKPLALYLFTANKDTEKKFLHEVPFGGGCVNDTIIHLATSNMGFGGVGNSGMGSYHGKKSFTTFSHEKSIVKKHTWIDLDMRYQPYSKLKGEMIRMFLK